MDRLICTVAFSALVMFYMFPVACITITVTLLTALAVKFLDFGEKERILLKDKAVLVTGCDTGFGHHLAKQLSSLGVTVFAGCLHSSGEGATALKELGDPNLHVVQMDVTKDKEIQDVVRTVKQTVGDKGFWGLVNNAGLNFMGDIELTTMEQYERVVSINQLGMVRVTKAFLPLIRNTKGRVVNVTSVKGRLSVIHDSAYDMTKFAGEAFSDILRMEMAKFGVKVVIIEPGDYGGATGCMEMSRLRRDIETMWDNMSPKLQETYGKEYVFHHLKCAESAIPFACTDLSNVTNAMIDGLFLVKPKPRYLVGGSKKWCDSYVVNIKAKPRSLIGGSKKWRNSYVIRVMLYAVMPEWYMDNIWLTETANSFPKPKALATEEIQS